MPKQTKPSLRQESLYRVKNWSDYEKALVRRGSITFWLSDDFEKNWRHTGEKQRGSQFDYSDQAILVMLTVKEIFHLTNRQTEGFMRSLFMLMKVSLPMRGHSTLSKHGKELKVNLPKKSSQSLNIVMDSTGLKVYGEGEWKVRQHGVLKRRKLHVGANPEDGEIQAVLLTENSVSDNDAVEALLEQIEQEVAKFAADGAYDKRKVYNGLNAHSRKNARIWKHGNTKAQRLKRDEDLRSIRKHGRKEWKKKSGYHVRSLAETTTLAPHCVWCNAGVFRLKTIFGNKLSARLLETQTTQTVVRCAALNRMTHLGMPQSYKVA